MTKYVAGFMFDNLAGDHVALIEKKHPEWQGGKLNAIGGKIEPDELAIEAMIREFSEETGMYTTFGQWKLFTVLQGDGYEVVFFVTTGDIRSLRSTTDEEVVIYSPDCVTVDNAIPSLTYLIPMAKLYLSSGRDFTNPTESLVITERAA